MVPASTGRSYVVHKYTWFLSLQDGPTWCTSTLGSCLYRTVLRGAQVHVVPASVGRSYGAQVHVVPASVGRSCMVHKYTWFLPLQDGPTWCTSTRGSCLCRTVLRGAQVHVVPASVGRSYVVHKYTWFLPL